MSACPDDNTFAAFMSGLMEAPRRAELEEHLDGCAMCAEVLANAARSHVAPASSDLQQVGRYQLLGAIGRGGMGVVYEALDPTLERVVAVKLLRPGVGREAGARLVAEAKSLARLNHPNVVRVLDAGEDDGHYYVAMEYLAGTTLYDWLRARPRSAAEVLAVFEQLGRGLVAVHAAGLTHRDVKPSNILVDEYGKATLIDFGLALDGRPDMALASREIAGTFAYMAPEQLRGEHVGPAADQYAFGVTLHEALFGWRPGSESHTTTAPSSPAVTEPLPPWLRHILVRSVQHDPRQRWPDLASMLDQLQISERDEARAQYRLNALFQLLLWPFHVALNLLMLKVLLTPNDAPPTPIASQSVDFLAGAMATWLIGAFLTGWAPLGLIWAPLNAYGLLRGRRWALRSTVIYFIFALPSIIGTPFAVYAFATLWRKAFPRRR